MKPAKFLLRASVGCLGLYGLLTLFENLVNLSYGLSFNRVKLFDNRWDHALQSTLRNQQTTLLYVGALGFMLWAIWRDEEAEWTVAARSALRLAVYFLVGGVLARFLWTGTYGPQQPTEEGRLWLYLGQYLAFLIVAFGFTLALHALASNQIPNLMEKAIARFRENVVRGQTLLAVGVLLSFAPVAGLALSSSQVIDAGRWFTSMVALPVLLISFSLLSMSILAARDLALRVVDETA